MFRTLAEMPLARLVPLAAGWFALVAVADHATGDEWPLAIGYLPLVALACWRLSLRAAFIAAAICSVLWLVDDACIGTGTIHLPRHYWTAGVHFVFFAVVATVLWRLRLAHESELRTARTDFLTGLANRSAFVEAAEGELARMRRGGGPLSIAYLDCDNFKRVNDERGHLAGDRLLRDTADVLRTYVRECDLPARLGGDEFGVLLPDTTAEQAELVIERLHAELNQMARTHHESAAFSVGAATFHDKPASVDELLHAADRRMYAAKRDRKLTAAIAPALV